MISPDTLAEWKRLADNLRPGRVWVNVHTGHETTIISFSSRMEERIGRNGSVTIPPACTVAHSAGQPPGKWFGIASEDLGSFVEHWRPAPELSPDAKASAYLHDRRKLESPRTRRRYA